MTTLQMVFRKRPFKISHQYSEHTFKHYYETAYRASYYYCGNADIAEDAAQETMAKVIQKIEQLKDPKKVKPWIRRIAVNTTVDIYNERKKFTNIEDMALWADTQENTPEYVIDLEESNRVLDEAIRSLDETSIKVIRLRFYEQMKIKEIATILDKPEGTIKTIIHRAKITIKKKL